MRVVFPESMCAEIPIFRFIFRSSSLNAVRSAAAFSAFDEKVEEVSSDDKDVDSFVFGFSDLLVVRTDEEVSRRNIIALIVGAF